MKNWLSGFQGGMLLLSVISTLFKGLIGIVVIIVGIKLIKKAFFRKDKLNIEFLLKNYPKDDIICNRNDK